MDQINYPVEKRSPNATTRVNNVMAIRIVIQAKTRQIVQVNKKSAKDETAFRFI